jgi:glycerol-3-phosphate dehydrogenase (NAD(P)+)
MSIAILGAGAFGTALAIALARAGKVVTLWSRDPSHADEMRLLRRNERRLPGIGIPATVSLSADFADVLTSPTWLAAVPAQQLDRLLADRAQGNCAARIVACAKGIDLTSGLGPTALIAARCPHAIPAVLTGPSFAADIARGLPTALTLACVDDAAGRALQEELSTPTLRLYRTEDVTGAELGGALKNVIAIAAGFAIGAGLGESARAAVVTRGFAEMLRLALGMGARPETLSGLSGLGDLILTATSEQSRNYRFGLALGRREAFDPTVTVEGAATARAAVAVAERHGVDMPLTRMVALLVDGRIAPDQVVATLLSRPLRKET